MPCESNNPKHPESGFLTQDCVIRMQFLLLPSCIFYPTDVSGFPLKMFSHQAQHRCCPFSSDNLLQINPFNKFSNCHRILINVICANFGGVSTKCPILNSKVMGQWCYLTGWYGELWYAPNCSVIKLGVGWYDSSEVADMLHLDYGTYEEWGWWYGT